jgi:hypothetical protein
MSTWWIVVRLPCCSGLPWTRYIIVNRYGSTRCQKSKQARVRLDRIVTPNRKVEVKLLSPYSVCRTRSIIASCTPNVFNLLTRIPQPRQQHEAIFHHLIGTSPKLPESRFRKVIHPLATLPSTPPRVNPHKHLLSPDSYSEREDKRLKQADNSSKAKVDEQLNSNMSSEEDYDDFVYDDEDHGFEQDGMEPGMSSAAGVMPWKQAEIFRIRV